MARQTCETLFLHMGFSVECSLWELPAGPLLRETAISFWGQKPGSYRRGPVLWQSDDIEDKLMDYYLCIWLR